ncbi:YbaN family protein [bacterium]|nr:YbaN family protein [bacterium]
MTPKKFFWLVLGFLCLGMAYVGLILPGIPFSIFLVGAAYCFAKSSPRMHAWIYNHKYFGPFLTNWTQKKVFPTKGKYLMVTVMSSSLAFLWFTTYNVNAVAWSGGFMLLVAIWAWRYPGSVDEYERRKENGEKIAWLK